MTNQHYTDAKVTQKPIFGKYTYLVLSKSRIRRSIPRSFAQLQPDSSSILNAQTWERYYIFAFNSEKGISQNIEQFVSSFCLRSGALKWIRASLLLTELFIFLTRNVGNSHYISSVFQLWYTPTENILRYAAKCYLSVFLCEFTLSVLRASSQMPCAKHFPSVPQFLIIGTLESPGKFNVAIGLCLCSAMCQFSLEDHEM